MKKTSCICFGAFDGIHPGHVAYFEHAKALSDCLSIFIEENLPASLTIQEREKVLTDLGYFESVMVGDEDEFIALIANTDSTVLLGVEYSDRRKTRFVTKLRSVLPRSDEQIVYHSNEFLKKLSDRSQPVGNLLPEWYEIGKAYDGMKHLVDLTACEEVLLAGNSASKILVVGDVIVDRYVICDAGEKSLEVPLVVGLERETSLYVGGAGVVAAHFAGLGFDVYLASTIGNDSEGNWVSSELKKKGVTLVSIGSMDRTIVKTRFMVDGLKMFRTSRIGLPDVDIGCVASRVFEAGCENFDALICSDFGYGVASGEVLECLTANFPDRTLTALDSQARNGDVKLYKSIGFDYIFPTELEARLALRDTSSHLESLAHKMIKHSKCANLVMKLGELGFTLYAPASRARIKSLREHFPSAAVRVRDVNGAGDCLMAHFIAARLRWGDQFIAGLIASIAAGLSVGKLGNVPITYGEINDHLQKQLQRRGVGI